MPGAEAWALTKILVMNSILKRTELQRSLKAPELQRSLKWSGNYRARWHDYRARAIYHITLLKAPGCESFGRLGGDSAVPPGSPGSPYLIASPTGKCIKEALRRLPEIHPSLRLFQYALMPDHLHLLLSVESELDDILGRKLAIFKVMVNKLSSQEQVFQKGFNDQIVGPDRKLDAIYRYLRENPYRLAVRMARPGSFRRVTTLQIGGSAYSAYGNLQLLDNPFKEQVVVHRADDQPTRADNFNRWLHCVANGGVLVSPFISKDEKAVREAAEDVDGRIILITDRSFGEKEKPASRDFGQCLKNRLLILTPLSENLQTMSARGRFLAMNDHARRIASLR